MVYRKETVLPSPFLTRTCGAVAVLLAASISLAFPSRGVRAAAGFDALLAQAVHNTDTVRTIMQTDRSTITTPKGTIVFSERGEEDEVRNRERDSESVSVTAFRKGRAPRKLHYTASVIFLNGHTYFRSSLNKNHWQLHAGTVFLDPYTGGFRRGRTTVDLPSGVKLVEMAASEGETHLHGTFSNSKKRGTIDLWISGGTTPYVVRENELYEPAAVPTATFRLHTVFGPFNQQIVIEAPPKGT